MAWNGSPSNGSARFLFDYDDPEDEDELAIVGYSCNIYQDSEKFIQVNDGNFLIKWAGDPNVLIDRFDALGHFTDQNALDTAGAIDCEIDEKIEAACDKERYFELSDSWRQQQLLEEEDRKRAAASAGFRAVAFNYGDEGDEVGNGEQEQREEQEEEQQQQQQAGSIEADDPDDNLPYEVPANLDVPAGTELPSTRRQGAIIDKTAQFVARQGAQMEIVLKTKQAGNAQFGFLTYGDRLHAFYRLVLGLVRQGRYVPLAPPRQMNPAPESPESQEPTKLPKVSTAGTSYAKLLREIQQREAVRQPDAQRQTPPPPPPPPPPPTPPPEREGQEESGDSSSQTPATIDESNGDAPDDLEEPDAESKLIIDKMAAYVAKNGTDFEQIVRGRGDPRFLFLNPGHSLHPYYTRQCRLLSCPADSSQTPPPPPPPPPPPLPPPTSTSTSQTSSSAPSSQPAAECDEYVRKQLERKRKAIAFLARLNSSRSEADLQAVGADAGLRESRSDACLSESAKRQKKKKSRKRLDEADDARASRKRRKR